MLQLPTVILHHQTLAGCHYDWLWLDPVSRKHLEGYRIPCSPDQWLSRQSFLCEPLLPHRLAYLDYQGLLTGGRGKVLQVSKGTVQGGRIGDVGWDWQVALTGSHATSQSLRVRVWPISDQHWRCAVSHTSCSI